MLVLRSKPVSSSSLLVDWEEPEHSNGKITSYFVYYKPRHDGDKQGAHQDPREDTVQEVDLPEVDLEASTDSSGDERAFVIVQAPHTQVSVPVKTLDTPERVMVQALYTQERGMVQGSRPCTLRSVMVQAPHNQECVMVQAPHNQERGDRKSVV